MGSRGDPGELEWHAQGFNPTRLQNTPALSGNSLMEQARLCQKGSGQWRLLTTASLCCMAPTQPVLLPLHCIGLSMASLSSTQVMALSSQSGICPCVVSNAPFLLARAQLCEGGWSPLHLCLAGRFAAVLEERSLSIGFLQGLAFLSCLSLWSGDPSGRAGRMLSLPQAVSERTKQKPDQQISMPVERTVSQSPGTKAAQRSNQASVRGCGRLGSLCLAAGDWAVPVQRMLFLAFS